MGQIHVTRIFPDRDALIRLSAGTGQATRWMGRGPPRSRRDLGLDVLASNHKKCTRHASNTTPGDLPGTFHLVDCLL
jgi:hypothetical protein